MCVSTKMNEMKRPGRSSRPARSPHPYNKIIEFIERNADEQIRFLIDLCNQNSYTHSRAGTDRVAGMILDRIHRLFPIHQVVEQKPAGSLHLLRTRTDVKSTYLLGHMDTVFPPEHPFQACRLDKDLLRGPGTADMKGGLAVIVYALLALKTSGLWEDIPLSLILSGDEEIGSVYSHAVYETERQNARACIVAECGGKEGEIVVSRNGKLGARIDCRGEDRHVGFGTHEKSSAILELAHKIVALESLNDSLPGVSVNVGKIEGGLGPCTIPGDAHALLDVRWRDQEQQSILLEKIDSLIAEARQPGCSSELTVLNRRPAMPEHDGSLRLFQLFQDQGRCLGQKLGREHRRGTSDANFFGSAGVPTLDGLGPVGFDDHTPEERILIASLKERTALLAMGLARMNIGENHFT